jgi:hypothetical protein
MDWIVAELSTCRLPAAVTSRPERTYIVRGGDCIGRTGCIVPRASCSLRKDEPSLVKSAGCRYARQDHLMQIRRTCTSGTGFQIRWFDNPESRGPNGPTSIPRNRMSFRHYIYVSEIAAMTSSGTLDAGSSSRPTKRAGASPAARF